MALRRTLTGLVLGVMALTLFMGCVESGAPLLPPPPVVETPPPPTPPLYFVNVSSLALRGGPTTAAPQIGTLQFNDEVEILESNSGWAKVVDVRHDRSGWVSRRYLQPVPSDRPRPVPRRRPAPAPPKEPAQPAEPPKAM